MTEVQRNKHVQRLAHQRDRKQVVQVSPKHDRAGQHDHHRPAEPRQTLNDALPRRQDVARRRLGDEEMQGVGGDQRPQERISVIRRDDAVEDEIVRPDRAEQMDEPGTECPPAVAASRLWRGEFGLRCYSGADVERSRRARGGSLSRFQKEANPNHAFVATRPAPDAREYNQVFSSEQPRRNLTS